MLQSRQWLSMRCNSQWLAAAVAAAAAAAEAAVFRPESRVQLMLAHLLFKARVRGRCCS